MSRRGRANGVRGPASALTSYLQEQNIRTGPMNMYQRRVTNEAPAAQSEETPGAGPSNQSPEPEESPEEDEANGMKRKRDEDEEYDSDDLDDNPQDSVTPAAKKGKAVAKPVDTKVSAKAKAAAKKKAQKDGTYKSDDDEEDGNGFGAPSRMMTGPRPPIGSMETCAKCKKKFPVTKYTQPASPPPGYLCHTCTTAAGIDPFKKATAPKPKRKATDKRKIVNFEDKDPIASLANTCISVITKHIEDVEALGNIGSQNLDNICKILSRMRKLTPGNAILFYDVENTNLTMYDCSALDPDSLCTLASLNPNLESIRLEFCGRITDDVLSHWSKHLPHLKSLDLLGPFNVKTSAWDTFIQSTSQPLERFHITQSPRFDFLCLNTLRKRCAGVMTSLRLKEMAKMNDDWVDQLALFKNLTSLDISRPARSVSEEAMTELLIEIGGNLTHLDISGHEDITDRVLLQGLKPHAKKLISLVASDLPLLTNFGVAKFFGANVELPDAKEEPEDSEDGVMDVEMANGDTNLSPRANAGADTSTTRAIDETSIPDPELERSKFINDSSIPPLQHIDFSRNPLLSSLALSSLLKHSGVSLHSLNINQWKDTDNETLLTLASSAPHLVKLDVGWCRDVDNFVMKELIDRCPRLKEVLVAGCNRLTSDCPRRRGLVIRGIEPGV